MTTGTQDDLQRIQRRARAVIVTVIVLFLLAVAALGWFLVQRDRQEQQLTELSATGLTSAAVPDLGLDLHDVEPLARNRGLAVTYADAAGAPAPGVRALTLRTGRDQDLCGLLVSVEPDLAADCTVREGSLQARGTGALVASGQLRDGSLIVLVADPSEHAAEDLTVKVATAELVPLDELLDRLD